MPIFNKNRDKKKFNETKVGKFLKEKAPNLAGEVIYTIGDITGVETLSRIGEKITGSKELSETDKQLALAYLQVDISEFQEISNRWKYDMESDSWLSKNARPLVLLTAWLNLYLLTYLDSFTNIVFDVKPMYINTFEGLLWLVSAAYFGSRGIRYMENRRIKNGKDPLSLFRNK